MIRESRTFPAKMDVVPKMMDYVAGLVDEFSPKTAYDTTLVCEEILVNIASYAYPEDGGQLVIVWENDIENKELKISFKDSGIPFNPLLKEEPDLNVPMSKREIGGLGIMMIRKLMDDAQYEYSNGMNILSVKKRY